METEKKPWSFCETPEEKCTASYCDNTDKIGLEKLDASNVVYAIIEEGKASASWEDVARNDGLLMQDFQNWFKECDKTKPLAIIHFTEFRYRN